MSLTQTKIKCFLRCRVIARARMAHLSVRLPQRPQGGLAKLLLQQPGVAIRTAGAGTAGNASGTASNIANTCRCAG